MRECHCEIPNPHANPRTRDRCVSCGFLIPARCISNDASVGEFYDRLQTALFPNATPDDIPDDFLRFRHQCEARERAGREKFGLGYLARMNPLEATEEASDGGNYVFFDSLVEIRASGEDRNIDLVLEAARRAFEFHKACHTLRAHRLGSP